MDRLLVYWPTEPVLFRGKGIGEAWRDEFLRVAPYELTDDPSQADVAFFYSDSVLDREVAMEVPSVGYCWGFMPKRFLDRDFQNWVQERSSLYNFCTFVLVPSLVTQDQLYQLGIESIFLPAGVDSATLDKPVPAMARKRQVLFLSRIVPHKRLDILIRAMSALKMPLVVSGPGDAAPYKALADALGVPISFYEFTDEEKVIAIKESVFLVHPSEYEGFSLPPCEALYLGTPILVSNIPQHRHLLQGYALYFDSVVDLASLLIEGLNSYDKVLSAIPQAQEFVRRNYTLTLASQRLSKVFHEAIRQFCGQKVREQPLGAGKWYNLDRRRDWVYKSQHFDPSWAQHWRAQEIIKALDGCESVIDIGSGAVYPVILALAGFTTTAYDISPVCLNQMWKLARRYGVESHLAAFEGTAGHISAVDNTYDAAVLGDILEHIADPKQVLAEAYRVARKRVIATFPVGEQHYDPMHLSIFDDKKVEELFVGLDARVQKIAEDGKKASEYFVVVEKRLKGVDRR